MKHFFVFSSHLQISFLKTMLWSPKWFHYVVLKLFLPVRDSGLYLSPLFIAQCWKRLSRSPKCGIKLLRLSSTTCSRHQFMCFIFIYCAMLKTIKLRIILSYCAIKESFEAFFLFFITFANIFLKNNAMVS